MYKAQAMIHSKNKIGTIEVLYKVKDNDYVCKTEDGVICHCIYNIFSGLYYADDIYRVVND